MPRRQLFLRGSSCARCRIYTSGNFTVGCNYPYGRKNAEELISGGYEQDTPAAIVYKASWPEEKVLNCTVKTVAQTAKEAGVTKTALIVVGRVLDGKYERSKLYDPTFTTEFRKASSHVGKAEKENTKE